MKVLIMIKMKLIKGRYASKAAKEIDDPIKLKSLLMDAIKD